LIKKLYGSHPQFSPANKQGWACSSSESPAIPVYKQDIPVYIISLIFADIFKAILSVYEEKT
jgi:hypothetical protein